MSRKRFWISLSLFLLATSARAVGIEAALAPDPADQPLALRIWYPSNANDAVQGNALPLIIISHGTGGGNDNHDDTARALAENGFVVAAITHTGDNYRDKSYLQQRKHLSERPRHVVRTIDYMLNSWHAHQQLDANRIGMFGFSAGGFTALVLAGGKPDFTRFQSHCQQTPAAWDCEYLRKNGVSLQRLSSTPAIQWIHDARIKAAVIAAPAVGYTFEPQGLVEVHIPIQLWNAGRDQIVDNSASIVRKLLPATTEFHSVPNAGHFSFLKPCDWKLSTIVGVMSWFGTERICSDPDHFNREQFHQSFNTQVVRFFATQLH
jgi:predicted dienelactone hydrolase